MGAFEGLFSHSLGRLITAYRAKQHQHDQKKSIPTLSHVTVSFIQR
jgi:hypothetical protein